MILNAGPSKHLSGHFGVGGDGAVQPAGGGGRVGVGGSNGRGGGGENE